jgi:hypothetical protein
MALYSEPTSMMRSSMSMCVDAAPNVSGRMAREKHAVKVEPPRPSDAMKSGTCLRCGCKTGTAHAGPGDCIDALREALAEVYSGEVRRIGRPSRVRSKGATEGATPMETGGNHGQLPLSANR